MNSIRSSIQQFTGWGPRSAFAQALAATAVLVGFCFITRTAIAQPTRADAEKDPVLAAMLTELDRSMSQLQLPDFAKPFFIQYRIEEVDDFSTKADFGSSEGSSRAHQRVVHMRRRAPPHSSGHQLEQGMRAHASALGRR